MANANQMFTRTITTWKATAYGISWEGDTPKAVKLGSAEFVATNATKTDARKALKAAGIDCPRGTEIRLEEVEAVVYGMSVETFMQYAKPIERGVKADEQ